MNNDDTKKTKWEWSKTYLIWNSSNAWRITLLIKNDDDERQKRYLFHFSRVSKENVFSRVAIATSEYSIFYGYKWQTKIK